MPQALILQVGTGEAKVPIKLTAAQVRLAIKRYARRVGIQVQGKTDIEIGEAVLKHWLREAAEQAAQEYRQEQISTQMEAIETLVKAETEFIDPEPPPSIGD